MIIGYARVSTDEQTTDMQLRLLKQSGAMRIFEESASSVGHRPQLQLAIEALLPGYTLAVYKVDRLARSLIDLLQILAKIDARFASVKSITEPIDTSTPAGRMMMQMLGAFAEFERSMIRERTKAGLNAARLRGQQFGRRRSLDAFDEAELVNLYLTGQHSMAGLGQLFGISESASKRAIYRRTKPDSKSLL